MYHNFIQALTVAQKNKNDLFGWLCGTVRERMSSTGDPSLFCARTAADE